MKWLLLLLSISTSLAQLNLRDPSFIASTYPTASGPPVTGYTMWIDPSDSSTVFTNSAGTLGQGMTNVVVRFLKDKSVHGTNFLRSFNDADSPTYVGTNLFSTGLPGLKLGNMMTTNTNFEITTNKGAITLFIVAKRYNGGTDPSRDLIGWSLGGAFTARWQFEDNGEAGQPFSMKIYTGPSFPVFSGSVNLSNDIAYAWCLQWDAGPSGTNTTFWTGYQRNAGVRTTDTLPLQNILGVGRFANLGGSQRWFGAWSEVIVYPRLLTGLEVTNTMNYLVPKWGTKLVP